MIITNLEFKVVKLYPKVSFKIALTEHTVADTVFVKISTSSGLIGFGEANPFAPVTGESVETIQAFLSRLKSLLIGKSPYELEDIHKIMNRLAVGNSAAKAGVDIALYDLCSKNANLPLYRYLGGTSPLVFSDMTIGIDPPDIMAKKAQEYVGQGFKMLKVKVGLNPAEDLMAVRMIRDRVGPEVEIRLDANQGWNTKQAINTMRLMAEYGVSEIEQPLAFHDLDGMAFIKNNISQDLMADESVHTPQDALKVIKAGACDIINIKLMKSSGIYPALQINALAEAANTPCMVGCMSESILGIAAGASLCASRNNISYADLDGHLVIDNVPGLKGGFFQKGGQITLLEKPGHGVDVNLFD